MSIASNSPTQNELGTLPSRSECSTLPRSPESDSDAIDSETNPDESPIFFQRKPSLASSFMILLRLPKKLILSPKLGWLMVLISISLHSILLFAPTPSEQKPKPKPTKSEKQVRITKLPTSPKSPTVKASPQPSPTPKKAPPTPKPKAVNPSQIVIPPPPKDEPTPPKPKEEPTPPPPKDEPTPPKQKDEPTPPETKDKPTHKIQQSPDSNPTPPPSSGDNPWADFPRYPGALPGCFKLESCSQTGKDLNQVASFFEKELVTKKYDAKPTIQEPTRKVYQVSKNGMTQFLSIIFAGEEGTVYVLGPDPLSLVDLKGAVEVPPEVANILTGLDPQKADPTYFAQPDLFYSQNGNSSTTLPGISNISLISEQTADTFMDAFLSTNLRNNNFEVTNPPKKYGGGDLYEVTKEQLKLYINLIPTKDSTGTLVVIWGSPPV